jgi:hypothetical protein
MDVARLRISGGVMEKGMSSRRSRCALGELGWWKSISRVVSRSGEGVGPGVVNWELWRW